MINASNASNPTWAYFDKGELPTPRTVLHRLSLADCLEVASPCFQEASFRLDGQIIGICDHRQDCREEYECEVFAALLLMPAIHFRDHLARIPGLTHQGFDWVAWLANTYEVEEWAVRFRVCLFNEGYFCPYKGEAKKWV